MKKEYAFWMTKRVSENGLNHYNTEEDEESCKSFYENYVPTRISIDKKRNAAYAGKCYFAECESGWDFNPRFNGYCADFNPVDLNANLYLYEKLFIRTENECGNKDKGEKLYSGKLLHREEKYTRYANRFSGKGGIR